METVAAKCPVCNATREYPSETIGKYTLCQSCGARFYVEVPPLAESQGGLVIAEPKPTITPQQDTRRDDVLRDTQKGERDILQWMRRQEASARTTRWLLAATVLLGLVNLAGIAILLLRR